MSNTIRPYEVKRRAVLIGVWDYGPKLGSLSNAITDLHDLGKLLSSELHPDYRWHVDRPPPEQTAPAIRNYLNKLMVGSPYRELFVALTGHGGRLNGGPLSFVTNDAVYNNPHEFGIPMSEIGSMLSEICEHYEKTIVLLDYCHAGGTVPSLDRSVTCQLQSNERLAVFAASRSTEQAASGWGNEPSFTRHFIDAVSNARPGSNGRVLLADIAQTLAQRMERSRVQTPVIRIEYRLVDPFNYRANNLPKVFLVPEPRDRRFVGRKGVFTKFRANFASGAKEPVGLIGEPGVGKTAAAIEYCYRQKKSYDFIFWVDAQDSYTLADGFTQLAKELALGGPADYLPAKAKELVRHWLEENDDWLLVLDDAGESVLGDSETPPKLREYMPRVSTGDIIVTSKRRDLGWVGIDTPIELKRFTNYTSCAKLLLRRSGKDSPSTADLTAAEGISRKLEGMPFFLLQAGAYIRQKRISPRRYLKLLEKEEYAGINAGAWKVDELRRDDAAAFDVLGICSFLAYADVPIELVVHGFSRESEHVQKRLSDTSNGTQLNEILNKLYDSFLATPREGGSFSLNHGLVRDAVKDALSEEESHHYASAAVGAVRAVFPEPEYQNWPLCRNLIRHVLQFEAITIDERFYNSANAEMFVRGATYLREVGFFEESEHIFRHALTVLERSKQTLHLEEAGCLLQFAALRITQAHYKEATEMLKRASKLYREEKGSKSDEYALSIHELGRLYYSIGWLWRAEILVRAALEIRRGRSENYLPFLTSLNCLAAIHLSKSNIERADELTSEAVIVSGTDRENEHPEHSQALLNRARYFRAIDKLKDAKEYTERALAARIEFYGEDHPRIASCLFDLGELLTHAGSYEKGQTHLTNALNILRRVYGRNHPNCALVLSGLGEIYLRTGDLDSAEEAYGNAFAMCKGTISESHPKFVAGLKRYKELLERRGKALPEVDRILKSTTTKPTKSRGW